MENKRMTEKESLELISQMIQRTKNRVRLGDGNQLLLWGYTSVGVALLVYAAMLLTGNPNSNWLWFLIPVIGGPIQRRLNLNDKERKAARTYTDRISAEIWSMVGGTALAGMGLCLGFTLAGFDGRCWTTMLLYAFVVVGFATAAQGIVIRERSLMVGGMFSIVAGGALACCALCDVPLLAVWVLPLYIASFTLMMIVPGHALNRKAKKLCPAN